MGTIVSVNISDKKGAPKKPVLEIELIEGLGVKDDAHAAAGDRQISLLMIEDIKAAMEKSAGPGRCELTKAALKIRPGSFAENLTTGGIDLCSLALGDELIVGGRVRLRVSKIGKECHKPCSIFYQTGDCIMPRRGIFCEVLTSGKVKPGDGVDKG